MRTPSRWIAAASLVMVLATSKAQAAVQEGEVAPNFTKNQLDFPVFGQTTPRSLSDYAGKIVLLFVMGYS